MKLLFIISLFSALPIFVFSQVNRQDRTAMIYDSLSRQVATQLVVKKEVADSVLSYIAAARTAISALVRNRSLTEDVRKAGLQKITDTRNAKIAQLLTAAQIEKLKSIMAVEKNKRKPTPEVTPKG